MPYDRQWERLADAMNRIMVAARLCQDEAQNDIAAAIADRAVKIRCKLKQHATKAMYSSNVLEGMQFEIPPDLKAEHFDWEQSRPSAPWFVQRRTFDLPGFWWLDWIELFKTDVAKVLCRAGRASIEEGPSETGLTSTERPALESNPTRPASDAPSPGPAAARRRGAQPRKFEQTKAAQCYARALQRFAHEKWAGCGGRAREGDQVVAR